MALSEKMWCYMVIILVTFFKSNESDGPIVTINSGKIQGRIVENTILNSTYYAFQGIPYAKPPIGKLRFQPPVSPEPWNDIKQTTKDANMCVQDFMGDEDCLFLNVFTNSLPTEEISLVPVMFWIHGGAFYRGSQNSFGPEYLLKKNVVIVTINYRLNVFGTYALIGVISPDYDQNITGFLNTMDDAAPGNSGLKDQMLALQWVRDNIAKFNGDPNCITIMGESAGGASVQYLLQSNLAAGLFHRAIAMSGSTLNPIAFQFKPKDKFLWLKHILNISSNNTKEIIEKLQCLDAYELYNASTIYSVTNKASFIEAQPFVPSLEHEHPNAIIRNPSIEVIIHGNINKVPCMVGYVTGESLVYLPFINSGQLVVSDFNEDKSLLVSSMLYLRNTDDKKIVVDKILMKYFQNASVEDLPHFLHFQSYNVFINGIRAFVELLCDDISIHLYRFSYKGSINADTPEVAHLEDINYILFRTFVNLTAADKIISDRLTTFLTNFAKYGDPNSQEQDINWMPFTRRVKSYLEIGNNIETSTNPDEEDYVFWKTIIKKYSKYSYAIK